MPGERDRTGQEQQHSSCVTQRRPGPGQGAWGCVWPGEFATDGWSSMLSIYYGWARAGGLCPAWTTNAEIGVRILWPQQLWWSAGVGEGMEGGRFTLRGGLGGHGGISWGAAQRGGKGADSPCDCSLGRGREDAPILRGLLRGRRLLLRLLSPYWSSGWGRRQRGTD